MSIDTNHRSDIAPTPEAQTPTITLNYILWNHESMDAVPKVLDAVATSDIILLEQYGNSPEVREANEDLMNHILETGTETDAYDNLTLTPTIKIIKALAGSGKEIYFIDASDEDKEIVVSTEKQSEENSKLEQLFYAAQSDEIAAQLERAVQVTIERDSQRDLLMWDQVEEVVGLLTTDTNVSILVGASHSPISHATPEVPGRQIKTQRTWLDEREHTPPEKFRFDVINQLIRKLSLTDKHATQDELKQTVLQRYLDGFMQSHPDTEVTLAKGEDSWQKLLDEIDEHCKQPITRRQKWHLVNATIEKSPYINNTNYRSSSEIPAA